MYKIDEIKMLRLGQRDENLARPLTFDCSDWLEQYPEASIHILFRRPGESAIVPISTTLEGTTLTWLIHDFEVGKTGIGNAEFRAVDTAGLRRKSRIIPCSIEETLLGDDETVLYTQDQVDETLAHISEAAQSALAAKASEEAAALSAQEAGESAVSAGTAADVAVGAKDAAQAAQTAAETAQHQAEAAQSGVHADAVAAEQAKVAAQAAQASAQGAASQASADRTATESARADAEAAATHAEAVVEGIDQAGADQVAAVNAAGQAQVTAVNQVGTTQVGNVNAAGTTQVNAVQAKGTQVINSIPADYSALINDVTGLKSAKVNKDGLNEVKIKNLEDVQIGNMFPVLGFLDKENKYAYANSSGISLVYSDSTVQNCYRVPIKKNTHYVMTFARWLVLLDENLKSTAIGSQNVTEFDSGNAVWAELSFNVTTYPPSTYVMSEGTQLISEPYIYPDWISKESELEKKVDKEGYNQVLRKNIEGVQIGNLFSVLAETDQEGKYAYCSSVSSGLQYTTDSHFNCYFLKVEKNTDYVCTICRFLVKLDKNKSPIATSEQSLTSFNSGNAEYVSLSFNVNTYSEDSIIVSKGTSLIPKDYVYPDWLSHYSTAYKYKSFHKEGNLSDGDYILLDESVSLKKGEMLSFACDITSFSGLEIGWSTSVPGTQKYPYIEITQTQIIVHGQNSNGSAAVTLTHGLTITVNLQFKVVVDYNQFNVELISNGARYGGTAALFKSEQGKGFAISSGSTLTNCKLSWSSIDMNKKVWMFGDSYFGMTNPARWVHWLQENGFAVDALIDAYGGRASDNAVISLANLIKNGSPDYIVWCMGMNDGTDSNSQPSSAWVTGRDTVLGICEAYSIIPVFATIPSVPSIDHTYKNAWIRSSGYRYVDFDKAVGANVSNEWYAGMLSTDNVHPTEKGALALYGQFMADFPEIVIS